MIRNYRPLKIGENQIEGWFQFQYGTVDKWFTTQIPEAELPELVKNKAFSIVETKSGGDKWIRKASKEDMDLLTEAVTTSATMSFATVRAAKAEMTAKVVNSAV